MNNLVVRYKEVLDPCTCDLIGGLGRTPRNNAQLMGKVEVKLVAMVISASSASLLPRLERAPATGANAIVS